MFRESLLIHAERAPQVRYDPDRSRFRRLHITASVPPIEGQTSLDHSRQEYRQSEDATLERLAEMELISPATAISD